MTVISTIITRHYTAHASDSFVTIRRPNGFLEVVEKQAPKLIRVPAWRGVMGYWGLAQHGDDWNTLAWLRGQAGRAGDYASAADFSMSVAENLTRALSERAFATPQDRGLGIHFTAYEWIDNRWVPELFVFSNWTDATYTIVQPGGFRLTRETYAALKGRPDDRGEPACRLEVHAALHDSPLMFLFNNGDPVLFNPIADAILTSFRELSRRGQLQDPTSAATHLSIVRRPVEVVANLVTDLVAPGKRLVGGRPHDLAVSPGRVYESTTGD